MIWAELFDAGTRMMIDSTVSVPGMDQGYFREIDMEYQWPQERPDQINAELRENPLRGTYRPWPESFPWRSWVDYTSRYEGEDGGLKTNLYHWDYFFDQYAPTPADLGEIVPESDYDPNVDRTDQRIVRTLTPEEITATRHTEDEPTDYLRMPLYNEPGAKHGAACDLLQPIVLNQFAHTGPEYKLAINHSPLFAPVDMRHPEWYDLVDEGGNILDVEDKARRLSFRNDSSYRLYLRPANWRWVASVYAQYIYISWFEAFYTYQWFVMPYFNRPPYYPIRHDLIHTTQVPSFEYRGAEYSTDSGIDYSFNYSRAANWLRFQITDAQWWTLSSAYIFSGNDPATITIWMWPPDPGDIVLGIGEIDRLTGAEQVFWLRQNQNLSHVYQQQVIGSYIVLDFTVTV